MSLINDALKKAQKQRTGESPNLSSLPGVGGQSAIRIAKRSRPAEFNTLLISAGVGAGALLLVAVGAYFLFRSGGSNQAPAAAAEKPAVIAASTPSAPKSTATPPAPASAPATTPAFVLPIAAPSTVAKAIPPPVSTPASPKPDPQPQVVAATVAAPVQPPVETPRPAALPAKLEPRAITYIENLRVAGIRASATDCKVLMNDRVYRVGDTVEHEMGLKITGITSSSLTFEDERGSRYTRNF